MHMAVVRLGWPNVSNLRFTKAIRFLFASRLIDWDLYVHVRFRLRTIASEDEGPFPLVHIRLCPLSPWFCGYVFCITWFTSELRTPKTTKNRKTCTLIQPVARPASTPPKKKKVDFASARGLAKSPPTVHSNRSEAKCLHVRVVLVARGNQIEATYLELAWLTEVSISIQNRVLKSSICLRYESSFKTRSGSINGCLLALNEIDEASFLPHRVRLYLHWVTGVSRNSC